MKIRDFLLCAVGIPALYVVYLLVGVAWDAAVGVYVFVFSIPTNPAAFTLASFVLAVLAAGCAVTVYRELDENRPWQIFSWGQWRTTFRDNLAWYGLALVGVALACVDAYMALRLPAAPTDFGFRGWICFLGMASGLACLLFVVVDVVINTWRLWSDRPSHTPVKR